jgi:ABC-type multidrug transport system fused ATPase/permease subunit
MSSCSSCRYGGLVVLEEGGQGSREATTTSLTVGNLITFQLYWNMIRQSYSSLNNILVQFTSARGAAQRVSRYIRAVMSAVSR